MNNAVSSAAHGPFSKFCAPVPLGRWDSMSYWITGYHGFAERALKAANTPFAALLAWPVAATLWMKDVTGRRLPKSAGLFTVDSLDRFDSQFDVFWRELVRQNPDKLLAERTSCHAVVAFRHPDAQGTTMDFNGILQSGELRAYCTLTRQDHGFRLPALTHGDTQGIRGMRLVDYQSIEPEVDFLSGLLEVALRRCAKEGLYILEYLGGDAPWLRTSSTNLPLIESSLKTEILLPRIGPRLRCRTAGTRGLGPERLTDGDASFE